MTPSTEIAEFIMAVEGFRTKAYAATPAERARGIWTIGVGHTAGVKRGDVVTKEQALEYLKSDLDFAAHTAERERLELTQQQLDAVCSLIFNIGAGNFRKSSLCAYIRHGQYKAAADCFTLYNKVREKQKDGTVRLVVNRGLTSRRLMEREIFELPAPLDLLTLDSILSKYGFKRIEL